MNDSLLASVQLRLEKVCARFEAAWQAAGSGAAPPRIEDHLAGAAVPERQALLWELLRLELHYRRRRGERPDPGEYTARFPESSPLIRGALASAGPDRTLSAVQPAEMAGGLPCYPAVPGYAILGELGRGGMGVVYKAMHLALKRIVALKMVLAGGHASPQALARFRIEGEAIARLAHPNIVQVFEVGAHNGLPYCALEFVDGGSLEAKLKGGPLPPDEGARLVRALAAAMHRAHSRNIIHRDLTPANVLLTADGAPKVTDFGLARQLDADGQQTLSGAVMGTPSYMAPEQACGGAHEAGPSADVYALGAILYACLTGRPPFQGATQLEVLEKVRNQEPIPLRALHLGVPRDVETICLKCLRKEPEKRYSSANELAADLMRFERGEPVEARPVRPLERAAKWVRRNPVMAGMTVLVAVALLGGVAASTGFGLAAHQQSVLAKNKEADAVARGEELATANQTLTRTAEDLKRSRDDLETTLVRGWLRPLALQGGDKPMAAPEWEALWELATNRRGRLGYRFVEEASRTPVASRQLRDRAAVALAAAVGLDDELRAEVEALLMARLDDPTLGAEQKRNLALAASQWDGLDKSGALRTARQLTRAMRETKDDLVLQMLAQGLSAVTRRLEPEEAASVTTQATAIVAQAIKDTNNSQALTQLARCLSTVAGQMESNEAALVGTKLAAAFKGTGDPDALSDLAHGLSVTVAGMEPKEAATILIQAINEGKFIRLMNGAINPRAAQALDPALAAAIARMSPADAASTLTRAIEDAGDPYALSWLMQGLSAAGVELEAKDAAKTATTLAERMEDTRDPRALWPLADALSAVVARMDARYMARPSAILARAIRYTDDPDALSALAQGLSAVMAGMETRDAVPLTKILARAMTKHQHDSNAVLRVVGGLSAVVARMEGKAAALVLSELIETIGEPAILSCLAESLTSVAARTAPKDVGPALVRATTSLAKAVNDWSHTGWALLPLARSLSTLAALMEPKAAATVLGQAAAALVQAMKDGKDRNVQSGLTMGLSVIAGHMQAGDAATTLTQAMMETKDPHILSELALSVSAVAGPLGAKSAAALAQAAAALAQAMEDNPNSFARCQLAQDLSAVAARMEANAAVTVLARAIKATKDHQALCCLAKCLSAVAAHLEAKTAATVLGETAITLTQAISLTRDPVALSQLAEGLSAVADRMETNAAAAVLEQAALVLVRAIQKARDPQDSSRLAKPLAAIAACMEVKAATAVRAQAATILAQCLKDTRDRSAVPGLANGLSALANPLQARDAATILAQAMRDTREPYALSQLAEALSAVTIRLDATAAATVRAQAAASLLQAMNDTTQPYPTLWLSQGLTAVLVEPAETPFHLEMVASAVTSAACACHQLAALGFLMPMAEPPNCRLSTQQLVELLKMPTLTAGGRRVILDQLGHRYRRTFSDVWEFVRFANEQRLNLDFTNPPQRS
jgi:hypothetical protein